MIRDVLATILRGFAWLIWKIGFVIVLPFIGLHYARWLKPLILVVVLIPVFVLSIELHRQWVTDKHRFIAAYIIAKTEHLPVIYHNEKSFPGLVLGLSFPDEWQTYGEARAGLLTLQGGEDYRAVRFFLGHRLDKAMKLDLCFVVLGYVYGAIYAMLAAWATLRED